MAGGLARIKDASQNGKIVFINPRYVISVQEVPGGTQIVLSSGNGLGTSENVNVVVAAIQGAMG